MPTTDNNDDHERFTRRLLPCWVMVSHYPFGDVVGGKSLEMALAKSDARKRFKHDRRLLTWHCPEGTVGRYIRVQLENMDYLHFAQLEVIGMYGEEKALGRVSSVTCGHDITAAVIRPLADARDLEESYRRAVIADPMNLVFLRQYETFIREFEQVGASACAVPCAVMRCVVRGVTFRVQHRMFVSESESSVACACCHPASAPVAYPPSAPLAARSPPPPRRSSSSPTARTSAASAHSARAASSVSCATSSTPGRTSSSPSREARAAACAGSSRWETS